MKRIFLITSCLFAGLSAFAQPKLTTDNIE